MDHFNPMRKKREELQNNMDYVESILKKGAEKAREVARATLNAARKATGID